MTAVLFVAVTVYRLKPELLAAVQAALQSTVLQGASYEVTASKQTSAAHSLKDKWHALQHQHAQLFIVLICCMTSKSSSYTGMHDSTATLCGAYVTRLKCKCLQVQVVAVLPGTVRTWCMHCVLTAFVFSCMKSQIALRRDTPQAHATSVTHQVDSIQSELELVTSLTREYSQNNVRMYRQLQALTAPFVNGACTAVA
eukprot:5059-Heterococcus_DN1.PRE.2